MANKVVAKKAVKKKKATVPGRKVAAGQPVETRKAAKTASVPSGIGRVVSMKDWVARYAAANAPDGPAPDRQKSASKNKARK